LVLYSISSKHEKRRPLSRRWLRVSILALQRKRNKNNTLKELLRIHTCTVIVETELARFVSRLEKKNRENWNENRTLQVEPRILLRWKPSLRSNKLLWLFKTNQSGVVSIEMLIVVLVGRL
jgi:hypothetical protein